MVSTMYHFHAGTEAQNKWSQINFSQRGIAKAGSSELGKSERPVLRRE